MSWKINLSPLFTFLLSLTVMLFAAGACAQSDNKQTAETKTADIGANGGTYTLVKGEDPNDYKYQYSDVPGGVCEAYEKNLAHFSSEPYGMACGRKLDPALGFTRPQWEPLDPWKHQDLMKDIRRVRDWNRPPSIDPNDWEGLLKHIISWGLTVEIAHVDLDGDGKPENLLRVGKDRVCDPRKVWEREIPEGWKTILIADHALTRIEGNTFLIKDNVFLWKGKVYADSFTAYSEAWRKKEGHDAELTLNEFLRYGAGRICKFYYDAAPSGAKVKIRGGR